MKMTAIVVTAMAFCLGHLRAQDVTTDDTSANTDSIKSISIPVTYGGLPLQSYDVQKIHLQKGDTLVAKFDHGSIFDNRNNFAYLTSEIYCGDASVRGYAKYLTGIAPPCIFMSAHTIGVSVLSETFSYTTTNIPGTAYIYFHLLTAVGGKSIVDKWLNTCVEVEVD